MSKIFQYALLPQYYDFDPSQVVHNATYIRWLEDARTAFVRASPWTPEWMYAADLVPALTRTEIIYKVLIRLGDLVAIHPQITKIGKSVWSLTGEFVHPETGAEYARAAQTGCFVRKSTGRPAPIPAEFITFCHSYLTE